MPYKLCASSLRRRACRGRNLLLQYGEGSNRIGNIERVCLMLATEDGKSFDVTGFRLGDPPSVGVCITEMANAMRNQQGVAAQWQPQS